MMVSKVARCACPAKINLNLVICGRREDGYHLLESEMVPIEVADTLSVRISPGLAAVALKVSGREAPSGPENLVCRAAHLLLGRFGRDAQVKMHLEKRIPSGAGLGGGSSDAAAALRVLDQLLGLNVGAESLRALALELGADVPFFISGRPALVSGVGDRWSPLSSYPLAPLVVAFRGPGLATSEVYAAYDASLTSPRGDSTIPDFPRSSGSSPRNDLEDAASRIDPGVKLLKEAFFAHGACEVGMSGSGSAVFGLFPDGAAAEHCAERFCEDGIWAEATRVLRALPPIEELDPDLNW